MSILALPFSDETFSLTINERKLSESSLRYAAILSVLSIFLLLEGTIRFVTYKPAEYANQISELESRAITGASFEIFFGGLGFLLGISVLNFEFHWTFFTLVALWIQLLMGIFVFIVYTLEVPIHWGHSQVLPGVVGATSYPADSFSDSEATVALVFGGIICSMSLCALLQSLQLLCTAGLLSVQASSSPLSTGPLRAFAAWAIGLVLLYGLSTLIFGSMVLNAEGPGLTDQVFVFPPQVVRYASHSVTSGVLVLVYAAFLAGSLLYHKSFILLTCIWGIFTWIWLLCGEVLTQFSMAARDSSQGAAWAAPAAQVAGLLSVMIFGPLFVLGELQRERLHEEEADVGAQEFRPDVVKLSGNRQYEGARGVVGGL